nr:MAG: hypothetical protein 3 [Leviviridae sp.]
MMKSHANELLSIAQGILKDAQGAYPTEESGFVKDLARLTLLVKHRGLGVFTLDLPKLDDQLLLGLELGRLNVCGTTVRSKRCRVPRLFSGLYVRVFDNQSNLRFDADPTAIAFLRQLFCIGKKLEVPCSKKRELQAIKDYVDVERTIRKPTLQWESDVLSNDSDRLCLHLRDCLGSDLPLFPDDKPGDKAFRTSLLDRCQHIADAVSRELGSYHPDAVVDCRQDEGTPLGLRHGPGAVADQRGRYINKYTFPNWSSKLQRLYPFEYFGRMPNDQRDSPKDHEVPARLLCVPKTAKGPRIIASEPSEHMFTQQLLRSWLEERVKDTFLGSFINFRRQELSSELVERCSTDRRLCTVDLSSASDRLSLWLLERIFRKNPPLLDAIHASRTRYIFIPQTGETLLLKKFASQGTAITFPVQTIVFTVITLAATVGDEIYYMSHDELIKRLSRLRNQVRVFGDDIIAPTHGYVRITQLMHDLGLKVNLGKSFYRGYFRESCGQDSFKGYDVTPVKPKSVIPDNPASCVAVLDTSNNLFYKGYWNASEQLRNRLCRDSLTRFPSVGRDAAAKGFRSFLQPSWAFGDIGQVVPGTRDTNRHVLRDRFGSIVPGFPMRWNPKLQRVEVRVPTIRSGSKVRSFSCGYTGLLDGSLRPLDPDNILFQVCSDRGVPARPSHSNVRRWEALSTFM